jgi:hypothetical protein
LDSLLHSLPQVLQDYLRLLQMVFAQLTPVVLALAGLLQVIGLQCCQPAQP